MYKFNFIFLCGFKRTVLLLILHLSSRALEASMMSCQLPATHPPPASIDNEIPIPPPTESSPPPTPAPDDRQSDADEQLMAVMEMSKRQQEEDEKRRKQEEEELEEILKLSLTEK